MSAVTDRYKGFLRSEQVDLLIRRLQQYAGIRIESSHGVVTQCLEQRMSTLGIAQLDHYMEIFDYSINARAEWMALIDLLTVKETRFFRQPEAFECVRDYVETFLQQGPLPGELSFWSAGCSTGEETYSLGIMIEQVVRRFNPWLQWHGIGTDISFEAIDRAQRAIYPIEAVRDLPLTHRDGYLQREADEGWQIARSIRSQTHFFHSNLVHVNSVPFNDFNIIFCQNVLIYFERERQRWIIDQLVERLRPGGLLVLGAGEDARWLNSQMCRLQWPGVCAYRKTGG